MTQVSKITTIEVVLRAGPLVGERSRDRGGPGNAGVGLIVTGLLADLLT